MIKLNDIIRILYGKEGFRMKDISDIDANFKIKSSIQKENIKFYSIKNAPFKIYGVFWENGQFRRMPQAVADTVSEGVASLNTHTAGGRVRFKTDSPYVVIHAEMKNIGKMPHFAITGSAGFDLYIREDGKERYEGSFVPPFTLTDGYESIVTFCEKKTHEVTVNFPTYSEITELFIGLDADASVSEATPYKTEIPIVYYGSSITQGGCSSRPGNTYESMISQVLDCNYINLGFSGNAMGEDEIADYISGLEMSAFVYDYDHNAPTEEHLAATHEKMFKKIRESNPSLPIVIMSRPKYYLEEFEKQRLDTIKQTYNNAAARGDKNIYLLTGKELMELAQYNGTVDNCHPNDLGFASMSKALTEVLKKII